MTEDPLKVIETVFPEGSTGFPAFSVRAECHSNYVRVTAEAVVSRNGEDPEILETEPCLQATLKWDNCCHWWFGDGGLSKDGQGYLHICGSPQTFIDLIAWIYSKAPEWVEAWDA